MREKLNINTAVKVGGVLLALLIASKIASAFSKPSPPPSIDLPDSGSGIPKDWNPDVLANKLYTTMKGINFTASQVDDRNDAIFELATIPSDDMFVAVVNRFNSTYGNGETLQDWISDEYYLNENDIARLNQRFFNINLIGISGLDRASLMCGII